MSNVKKYKNTKLQKYPLPGRGGAAGAKFRISLACPVGAVMNCADNTGHYHDHDDVFLMMSVVY